MKGGIGEAFAAILSEELAVTQSDVIDLVARAASVHPLPLLRRLLSFSANTCSRQTLNSENLLLETVITVIHKNKCMLSYIFRN